jgi:hypothetical protein
MKRVDILNTAAQLIDNDRAHQYGDAKSEFARVAVIWSDLVGTPVAVQDVALLMIALKLVRATRNSQHADNWIDICGYAALGGEIATDE